MPALTLVAGIVPDGHAFLLALDRGNLVVQPIGDENLLTFERSLVGLIGGVEAEADDNSQSESSERQHGQRDLMRQRAAVVACAHAFRAGSPAACQSKSGLRSRYNIGGVSPCLTPADKRSPIRR
ncbi:hypothetical protein ACVOMV_19320 [Mesorhizobium atlanticum]